MGYKNSLSARSSSVLYSKWYCIVVKKGNIAWSLPYMFLFFHGSFVLYNVVLHSSWFHVCIINIDFGERVIV